MALVVAFIAAAQDVIVKNDNSTILCRIVEVTDNEVVYLKWSDLNGPRYVMDRSLIVNINYQDGRQDKLNQQISNAYSPSNQQTGEAQYNDQALLAMDKARANSRYVDYNKRAKNLKIIGWTVGPVLLITGISIVLVGQDVFGSAGYTSTYTTAAGILTMGIGIGTTVACLRKANQFHKKAQTISFSPVFQQEFNLGNGKFLSAGVDFIRDRQYKQTTLGLGFQYNF